MIPWEKIQGCTIPKTREMRRSDTDIQQRFDPAVIRTLFCTSWEGKVPNGEWLKSLREFSEVLEY